MKEPFPESEEEEESIVEEMGSFGREPELEEEAEPVTPLAKKRRRMEARASDKKKPTSTFKTPILPKRLVKTPRKGESF